jgi:hypothetical protein
MHIDSQPRMFPLKKKQVEYFENLSFHFFVKLILRKNTTNTFFFFTLDNIDYHTPLSAIVIKLSYLLKFEINIVKVGSVIIQVNLLTSLALDEKKLEP